MSIDDMKLIEAISALLDKKDEEFRKIVDEHNQHLKEMGYPATLYWVTYLRSNFANNFEAARKLVREFFGGDEEW